MDRKYHNLPVEDWRDRLNLYGINDEYQEYLRTGCYTMIEKGQGTRYYEDGYMSSDITIGPGPKDGWYSESGAFITMHPGSDREDLYHYDSFPLNIPPG